MFFRILRQSGIKDACYIWPASDNSMSLAYVGTLGGEVAALVSLFSVHVSELYERTKWPVRLKIIPSLRYALRSDFCKQKEFVRARVIAG
jgi:hypothetical protein